MRARQATAASAIATRRGMCSRPWCAPARVHRMSYSNGSLAASMQRMLKPAKMASTLTIPFSAPPRIVPAGPRRQDPRVGVCAEDAVARSNVVLSATSVRTELPAIAGCKDEIDQVIHHRVHHNVEWMTRVSRVIARRQLTGAIENRPGIYKYPRSVPRRNVQQTQELDELF